MFRLTSTKFLAFAAAALFATADTARADVVLNTGGNLTYTMPKENGKHFALHNVVLEAGKKYTFEMSSVHFDTYLKIKNPLNMIVAKNDDGGPKLNSKVVFTPLLSGMFRVVATTYKNDATGGYKLRVTRQDPIVPLPLPFPPLPLPGKVVLNVNGDLTHADPAKNSKHFDAFKVLLEAGKDYVINMESADFDTYLRVTNLAGIVLAQNDDGGFGRNSRLVFRPMVNGLYNIVATSYKTEATGGYHLRVTQGGILPPPPVVPGKIILNVQGDLKFTDPVKGGKHYHTHTLFMKGGNEYVLTMNSMHFDTYLRVTNNAGIVLVQNDDGGPGMNSRVVFRPMFSGMYTIVATSYSNDATGHYSLTVRD